ncbi:hypothetical protein SDC9_192639 [bioreactor metagenome]|uniref:Uncharacterized protein n=1 Tax=bioreactor metagenome TaxID=1076179 RepID=A0A645I2T4_9ZZZZ
MGNLYLASYPLTPKIYSEMRRLGESRASVIRLALCQYLGIDQTGKVIPTLEKIIWNKLTDEAKLHEISSQQLVRDIVDDYLARQPTIQIRPLEEIDAEIEEKINEIVSTYKNTNPYFEKARISQVRNRILAKRLKTRKCKSPLTVLDEALDHQAKILGRTREEIERDLLCAYFNIKQVIE